MNRYAYLLFAVAAIAMPFGACAENALPVLNPSAVKQILAKPTVKNAQISLKKLDLSRIAAIKGLGFQDGAMCIAPMPIAEASIDPHRSLMVHDTATLGAGNFTLRRTLQKLSSDVIASVPGTSPESIFRQLWDTQNDAAGAVTAGNPHCSDNDGKIGAYPLNMCPRPEGAEAVGTDAQIATRIDSYQPLALVNRLDLADAGWRNCGEHRIIYGKSGGGVAKNLIIFEAVLPNPKPGCRSACRPVIDFWTELSSDPNPASRASKLENYFYTGLPGFRPVVHTSHYSSGVSSVYGGSGSGQIRTDQFLGFPWTLKEFKTLLSCSGGTCDYDLMPINVKANPYGVLWNRDVANGGAPTPPPSNSFATPIAGLPALATNFQNEVLAQVTLDRLGNPDINTFTYEVKLDKDAAESQSLGPTIDHYRNQFNAASDASFRTSLNALAGGFGLTGDQVVNRAAAQSCAGCHQPSAFGLTSPNSIKPGQSWPDSLGFVHVDVFTRAFNVADGFDVTQFSGNANGFNISPALLTTFLPARRTNLVGIANEDVCDCVPKPGLVSIDKQARFKSILARSDSRIKAELDANRKAFSDKAGMKATDVSRFVAKSRSVIAKGEAERVAQLREIGVAVEPPPLKPEPVVLSRERLSKDALLKAKRAKIDQIVASEPPRKTITGSFRTH